MLLMGVCSFSASHDIYQRFLWRRRSVLQKRSKFIPYEKRPFTPVGCLWEVSVHTCLWEASVDTVCPLSVRSVSSHPSAVCEKRQLTPAHCLWEASVDTGYPLSVAAVCVYAGVLSQSGLAADGPIPAQHRRSQQHRGRKLLRRRLETPPGASRPPRPPPAPRLQHVLRRQIPQPGQPPIACVATDPHCVSGRMADQG